MSKHHFVSWHAFHDHRVGTFSPVGMSMSVEREMKLAGIHGRVTMHTDSARAYQVYNRRAEPTADEMSHITQSDIMSLLILDKNSDQLRQLCS